MLWDEIIKKSKLEKVYPKQILREEIQKSLLAIFSQEGYFEKIVFQGGTALRVFYNNPRFSEDINLAYRKNVKKVDIEFNFSKIKRSTKNIFPFLNEITYTIQKETQKLKRYKLKSKGENPSQNISIHIEVALVPSYYNKPRILEFAPLYPAIRVEDEIEILADKITALGCRNYIKGRDLWDIHLLTVEKNQKIQWELVKKKVKDYNYSIKEFNDNLKEKKKEINKDGMKILANELSRFLPPTVYIQYKDMFKIIILNVSKIIKQEL